VSVQPMGIRRWVAAGALVICAGCGDDAVPPPRLPTPPDLSGVWAGTWQGDDPSLGGLGLVSGTWDVEITQDASSASGAGVLLGDVDCMEGQLQVNPDTSSAVTGSLSRPPCASVGWTLTALDITSGSASGSWSNSGTGGTGTLTGTRVALLDGPRIAFVNPPGAKPGAIVTLKGERLSGLTVGEELRFNSTLQSLLLYADATRIVTRVPFGASSGPIKVTTSGGVALSPRSFNVDVTSAPAGLGGSTAAGVEPAALAVSPDGRKIYVADRGNMTVRVVRSSTLLDLVSVTVAGGIPRSVVASPEGRRVYVAATGRGVIVLDAANAATRDTISLASIDDGGRDNPQGLAVSPDGSLLLVSDGADGGSASLFRVADPTSRSR